MWLLVLTVTLAAIRVQSSDMTQCSWEKLNGGIEKMKILKQMMERMLEGDAPITMSPNSFTLFKNHIMMMNHLVVVSKNFLSPSDPVKGLVMKSPKTQEILSKIIETINGVNTMIERMLEDKAARTNLTLYHLLDKEMWWENRLLYLLIHLEFPSCITYINKAGTSIKGGERRAMSWSCGAKSFPFTKD